MENYFKKELRWYMFSLEHEDISDFYLSSWQRDRSCRPLLYIRTLIFISCLSILIPTMVLIKFEHWILFMTQWGLLLNTISSALAWTISAVEFNTGPNSSPRTLAKLYWAAFNAAITSAFFITIFRYTLFRMEVNDVLEFVGDVFAHIINSLLMFCLLITSRHPTRLLHFYMPVIFGIVYILFTLIYYLAGGLSPFNTTWLYPVLDWSRPGGTIMWVVISTCFTIVIHFVVVGITLGRDALTKRYRGPTIISVPNSMSISSKPPP